MIGLMNLEHTINVSFVKFVHVLEAFEIFHNIYSIFKKDISLKNALDLGHS